MGPEPPEADNKETGEEETRTPAGTREVARVVRVVRAEAPAIHRTHPNPVVLAIIDMEPTLGFVWPP